MVFDTDLLLTPQGVLSGGHDTGAEFWGDAGYTLNVDTGKLGLVPVNTGVLVPRPNDPTTGLTNATFTQFLSASFGVFAGKIFTLDAGAGEFAGNYRTQFQNIGLVS